MSEISASSLLSQVRALQERVRLDMKNGGATKADFSQLNQLRSDAKSVSSTSPDATDAYLLNSFIAQVSGSDPFANSIFDTAANKFEAGVSLMANIGGGSIFQAKGAPALAMPINPGDMQIWLSEIEAENAETQLQGDQSSIQESGAVQKEVNQKALGQFQEEQKNMQDASQKQQQSGITGWIAAVFELIGAALAVAGAVLAAVATGGAAAPLVAVAILGAMMAIDDFANQAVQQAGIQTTGADGTKEPLDITMGGMVKAIVQQQIKDGTIAISPNTGKPGAIVFKDQAALDSYITGWSIASTMIVAVAMVVVGGAGGIAVGLKEMAEEAGEAAFKAVTDAGGTTNAAKEAASAAADAAGKLFKGTVRGTISNMREAMGTALHEASIAEKVVDASTAANDIAGASTTVYQGTEEIDIAKDKNAAAVAQAEQQMLRAISDYLTQYMKTQSADAQDKAKVIQAVQKSASDTLQNITNTMIAVAHQDA